ncbi:Ig-like domain repeat protein [Nocardioides campestrisoli]|uniref:Ig-like domain repeat protein n=1 Tax=Nocardioides campestrisoli TaxID=2736757 RepID=UPI00163DC4EF|nr:Ig-like domain repeat protein [Nocardioides campestrisoli]
MKKLIAATAAAGLLSAGLIGAAGTAQAAPYPPTVETNPKVQGPLNAVAPGTPVKIRVNIAAAGNAKPKGKVTFVVRKPNGKKVKTVTRKYNSAKNFSVGKLPRGNYKVQVKFKTGKNSVFKNSKNSVRFKVGR